MERPMIIGGGSGGAVESSTTTSKDVPNGSPEEWNPSPQVVGREFVRQYYTLLNSSPPHLHRFYSTNSSFIHGGLEHINNANNGPANNNNSTNNNSGGNSLPATGQRAIHEKIMGLNFRDCHAKIRQVDAHATLDSGVVVQVSGELSNAGGPMRRFMQTFVLAPQSPRKYYVHNDIFRYQDEVFSDEDNEAGGGDIPMCGGEEDPKAPKVPPLHDKSNAQQHGMEEGGVSQGSLVNGGESGPPPKAEAPPSSTLPDVTAASNSSSSRPHSSPANTLAVNQIEGQTPPGGVSSSSQHIVVVDNNKEGGGGGGGITGAADPSGGAPDSLDAQEDHEDEDDLGGESSEASSVNNGVLTYAKLVKSGPSSSGGGGGSSGSKYKPGSPCDPKEGGPINHSGSSSHHQHHSASNNSHHHHSSSTASQQSQQHSSGHSSSSLSGGKSPYRGRGGSSGSLGRGPRERYSSRGELPPEDLPRSSPRPGGPLNSGGHFSDSQQLFVGNLPHNVSQGDLYALFGKFGKVLEIRINGRGASMAKTNPSGAKVPNYGFVVFEEEASVSECLKKKPIFLPEGNHRLNIEEKKVNKGLSIPGGGRMGGYGSSSLDSPSSSSSSNSRDLLPPSNRGGMSNNPSIRGNASSGSSRLSSVPRGGGGGRLYSSSSASSASSSSAGVSSSPSNAQTQQHMGGPPNRGGHPSSSRGGGNSGSSYPRRS